jgi:hypothetical protein
MGNIMDMVFMCQKEEIYTKKVSGLMVNFLEKEDCLNLVLQNTMGTF